MVSSSALEISTREPLTPLGHRFAWREEQQSGSQNMALHMPVWHRYIISHQCEVAHVLWGPCEAFYLRLLEELASWITVQLRLNLLLGAFDCLVLHFKIRANLTVESRSYNKHWVWKPFPELPSSTTWPLQKNLRSAVCLVTPNTRIFWWGRWTQAAYLSFLLEN